VHHYEEGREDSSKRAAGKSGGARFASVKVVGVLLMWVERE